jgi:hypothetical protein
MITPLAILGPHVIDSIGGPVIYIITKWGGYATCSLTKSKGRILHPKSDAIIKIKCRNQPPK